MPLGTAEAGRPTAEATSTLSSAAVAAVSAVVAGIAALSCCVMPLVFVVVGISGAWITHLTALSPYQPVFVAIALGSIAYGHFATYRTRRACAAGFVCARPLPRRLVTTGLWVGTLAIVVALGANIAAPYLL